MPEPKPAPESMLDRALAYLADGKPCFPVCSPAMGNHRHGKDACPRERWGKIPLVAWKAYQSRLPTEAEARDWWRTWPEANIGMATGALSGVVVLDADGTEARKGIMERRTEPTPVVWTGKVGGAHYWFAHPGHEVSNFARKLPGTDFRGDGGYVLLPPSLHASGARYRWAEGTERLPLAPLPGWLEGLQRAPDAADGEHEPLDLAVILDGIPDGQRNEILFRLACKLRGDDVPRRYAELMVGQAARSCRPPYDEADPAEIVRRVYRDYPAGRERSVLARGESAKDGRATPDTQIEQPKGYTAAELQRVVFQPPRFAVGDLIAEGLMLLAGRPKLGKSWLGLHLCVEVARGGLALGRIRVQQGEALYLALEDGDRRVQERLGLMLGDDPWPDGLHIFTQWPKVDIGGAVALDAWLSEHPDCRLVVIDTFKRIRARPNAKARLYDDDYEAMQPFAEIARARRVGIVPVMHARKGEAEDPLEMISGTTGLSGAADAAMVLRRERGAADASLFVTGRDIEERDMALRWEIDAFTWKWLGDAAEFRQSRERAQVQDAIRAMPGMKPAEIADALGRSRGSVRYLLFKLVRDGMVRVRSDGTYHPGIDNPTRSDEFLYPITNTANSATPANPPTPQTQTLTPDSPVSPVSGVTTDRGVSGVSGAAPKPSLICKDCGEPTGNPHMLRCEPCRKRWADPLDGVELPF